VTTVESLLHNAEAYATYPQHFQPLLQHLCLSYTLVVLFLRALPFDAFPSTPPFPFEDEMTLASTGMPKSVSSLSIASSVPNRKGPGSGWDSGAPSRPSHIPRAERPFELVMPEPLGAPKNDVDQIETIAPSAPPPVSAAQKHRRRSSIGSASIISWTGKARRGSASSQGTALTSPAMSSSAFTPMTGVQKKFPPVSFPSAKRYVFKGYGDPQASRSRTFSESGSRPGSIFSVDESIAPRSRYGDTQSIVPSLPRFGKRPPSSEVGSSWGRPGAGRHSPTIASGLRITSMNGDRTNHNNSPDYGRWGARTPEVIEPAFDKPLPYVVGRTPVLRIFVPLSPEVPTWPCAEGARRARSELERCGAWSKLRLGDVIVNTALSEPLIPRNIMLYIPTMQPFLCPLEYRYAEQGHLPGYLDAFTIPPSFYYPLLFAGRYVIHLDLGPWADAAADTLRLAFARSDITTTRGDKVTAKRYLHVIGFQITPQTRHQAVEEWYGMVSIEAEGTAEGRKELLRRLGRTPDGNKIQAHKGPFEIVREKSLGGNVWLRSVQLNMHLSSVY
jgi:hypothetical protein